MKENQWKSVVIADAISKGICNEYAELLSRSKDLPQFLHLYRRGVDWSLENDCPSIALMRQFPEERLDLHGIFIDKHFDGDVLMDRSVYIFQHCTGTIKTGLNVDRKEIPMLYFANGCDMRIESANDFVPPTPIKVPLYIFGANNVICEATPKILGITYNKEVK